MGIIQNIEKNEIQQIEKQRNNIPIPDFYPGDSIKVSVKVVEGTKQRIQVFEGVCISRSGRGLNQSFIVRKISFVEGVERIFPLYSPIIDKIEVVKHGKVRRAKLYYLRNLRGKAARIAEKKTGIIAKKLHIKNKKVINKKISQQTK